jgi:hypothetical protein
MGARHLISLHLCQYHNCTGYVFFDGYIAFSLLYGMVFAHLAFSISQEKTERFNYLIINPSL